MSSDKTGLNYDQTAPLGGSGGFSYPQPGAQTGGIDQGYGAPPPAYDTTQPGINSFKVIRQDRCHHDPLGQTHSLASSKHCFRLKYVLFC